MKRIHEACYDVGDLNVRRGTHAENNENWARNWERYFIVKQLLNQKI